MNTARVLFMLGKPAGGECVRPKVCGAIAALVVAGGVTLPAVATELAVDVLHDKDVILHLPLDSDFTSISNAAAFPATLNTNKASGGSIAFRAAEVNGQFVVDSLAAGRGRDNGGYLHIDKAAVAIDLTKFGIGYNCTNITVEGYIRGTYPGSMEKWATVLGMGAWTTNSAGVVTPTNPYYVLFSPTETAGQLYYRADGKMSTGAWRSNAYSVDGGLDGQWHHFAMIIEPFWWQDRYEKRIRCYLDHEYIGKNENEGPWHGYSDSGATNLYLRLGTTVSTVDFDEIRISKGTLLPHEFLRLRNRLPEDVAAAEPVMHMTFENQNLESAVFAEDSPYKSSGTPVYDTDVPAPYVSNGRHSGALRENTHSLTMNKSELRLYLSNWLLGVNGLREVTLEFFVKGSAEVPMTATWACPFRLVTGNKCGTETMFSYLLQINSSSNYYMRADYPLWVGAGSETTTGYSVSADVKNKFSDGKWHHVALTVKQTAQGTSRNELFFDYVSKSAWENPNRTWCGLMNNGYMTIGNGSAGKIWIDEIRISKGVLTKDQFMYARHNGGVILFVK